MDSKLFEKDVERKTVFKGAVFDIDSATVELPDGTLGRRDVMCHPGGVGVLPVDDQLYVYMVRQFRYGASNVLLEIPAGKLNYGEDPIVCGKRELSEETGLVCNELISLGELYPTPAISSEKIYIYLARSFASGERHLDEDEFLNVEKIHFTDLYNMVLNNEITDAKTQIAVLKAYRLLDL